MVRKCVVGTKGQITLPKALRDKYHFFNGEEVVLEPQKKGVLLMHAPSVLRGKFRGKLDIEGFEKDIKRIHEQWKL